MKNRATLLTVLFTILGIILLFVILCTLGFRFYWDINTAIDWEQTNPIFNIVMAIFTLLAIIVAIRIPQEDRKVSSRIDLFTQRFEAFYTIFKILDSNDYYSEKAANEEILKKVERTSYFLLEQEDFKRLAILIGTVISKYEDRDPYNSTPHGMRFIERDKEAEIDELYEIFEKYLTLGKFGVL